MNKLPDNQQKYNLLEETRNVLKNNFGLTPCIGAEIEFYLGDEVSIPALEKIIGHAIKVEKGKNQYEIDLRPSNALVEYTKYIELVRDKVEQGAEELGGKADFSSKPYINDYGNSMHIHLNFLEDNDIEKFARILCYYLSDDISVFLPLEEDWNRLDEKFMAPTHICYGGNNRTVAIRIPDSMPRRLEHRVPAASADPAAVVYAILVSIATGLSSQVDTKTYAKIFGNASDKQYGLKRILQYTI